MPVRYHVRPVAPMHQPFVSIPLGLAIDGGDAVRTAW